MSFRTDHDPMGSETGTARRGAAARVSDRGGVERPLKLVPVPPAMGSPAGRPLPPLRPGRRSGIDLPGPPDAPRWSPLLVALPLFAVVWLCVGVLAFASGA